MCVPNLLPLILWERKQVLLISKRHYIQILCIKLTEHSWIFKDSLVLCISCIVVLNVLGTRSGERK